MVLAEPSTSRPNKIEVELANIQAGQLGAFIEKYNNGNSERQLCRALTSSFHVRKLNGRKYKDAEIDTILEFFFNRLSHPACPSYRVHDVVTKLSTHWLKPGNISSLIARWPQSANVLSRMLASTSYRGRRYSQHPINKLGKDDLEIIHQALVGEGKKCPSGLEMNGLLNVKLRLLRPGTIEEHFNFCETCEKDSLIASCLSRSLWEIATRGKGKALSIDGSPAEKDILAVEAAVRRLQELGKISENGVLWVAKTRAQITRAEINGSAQKEKGLSKALLWLEQFPEPSVYSIFLSWLRRQIRTGKVAEGNISPAEAKKYREFAEVAGQGSAAHARNARRFLEWLDQREGKTTSGRKMFKSELNDELAKAVRKKNKVKIKELLAAGASPNTKSYRRSLVEHAVKGGDLEVVQILVEAGADFSLKRDNPQATKGRPIYRRRYGLGVRQDILAIALRAKQLEIFGYLLSKGARPSREAFLEALRLGDKRAVISLYKKGQFSLNDKSQTRVPLAIAIQSDNPEVVEFLIQQGADVNAGSGQRRTFYQLARSENVRAVLLKAGAIKDFYSSFLNRLKRSKVKHFAVQKREDGSCYVGRKIDFHGYKKLEWDEDSLKEDGPYADIIRAFRRDIAKKVNTDRLKKKLQKADPVDVYSECSNWITQCVDSFFSVDFNPTERDRLTRLDDCARSAPKCKTESPWKEKGPCCPSLCFERFQELRCAGAKFDAFTVPYALDTSCFPGVSGVWQR